MKLQRKSSQSGIGVLAVLLLIVVVAVLAGGGWYVYKANSEASSNLVQKTADSTATTQSKQSSGDDVAKANAFYDCWDKVGTVSSSRPATCSDNGKTYTEPQKFYKEAAIKYLDKVPAAAQPLVVSKVQAAFNSCLAKDAPNPLSRANVELAQANFVDVGISNCDSGAMHHFALDAGKWTYLGSGQLGLSCDTVDKYHITKASVILKPSDQGGPYDSCFDAAGNTKPIPAK